MNSRERLEASKSRLKKAFDDLEKGIKSLKKKAASSDKNLAIENGASNEMKQMEAVFCASLNKINNKILEIKKLELVSHE
jgi:hypothetical protein